MKTGKLSTKWCIVLWILPVAVGLFALGIGRVSLPVGQVISAIADVFSRNTTVPQLTRMTLWNLRLPRILLAALAGAGLSTAGCAFQSLFANPLATPDTLGVARGASFGAALGLLVGFSMVGVQLMALAMGALAVALTWMAGSGKNKGLSTIVLAGIMMGSLFTALVSLVKFAADEESQLPAITYWLMGGLNNADYKTLLLGAPAVIVGIAVLFALRWRMNLLPLSEDEARSSGVNIGVLRGITVISATMITASCVSMCGQVGWVGLLIPHMCRMKFGSNHLSLLPASISFGTAFLIIVDTVARSASAQEIPISILTAIIGAPFFILLMRKTGGWKL